MGVSVRKAIQKPRRPRGAALADYLLVTAAVAAITLPLASHYIGDRTLGVLRSRRQQLVSFIAQDRKKTVPNEWFNVERVPDPDPNLPEGDSRRPPTNPDQKSEGNPPPDDGPGTGPGSGPNDKNYRKSENPNFEPGGRRKADSPENSKDRWHRSRQDSIWAEFKFPERNQPHETTHENSSQDKGLRKRLSGSGESELLGGNLASNDVTVGSSEDRSRQKHMKDDLSNSRKKGGLISEGALGNVGGGSEGSFDWWFLLKLLILLLILFVIVLIIINNMKKRD